VSNHKKKLLINPLALLHLLQYSIQFLGLCLAKW